jgi:hypothetical protein
MLPSAATIVLFPEPPAGEKKAMFLRVAGFFSTGAVATASGAVDS